MNVQCCGQYCNKKIIHKTERNTTWEYTCKVCGNKSRGGIGY